MVRSRSEGADSHQRGFLFGQGLVTQDHLRQMLSLPGVDPAICPKAELARYRAVDAIDRDLETPGDLFGRKARVFALCLSSRRVLAWGFQSGVDPGFLHCC